MKKKNKNNRNISEKMVMLKMANRNEDKHDGGLQKKQRRIWFDGNDLIDIHYKIYVFV